MFLSQAFNSQHDWWRYLVGIAVVFVAVQIGSLPLVGAAMLKLIKEGRDFTEIKQADLLTTLEPNPTLFLLLLSFAAGLVALLVIIRHLHGQPIREATTGRARVDWGRIWFGFWLIAIPTIGLTLADYFSSPEDYVFQFQWVPFLVLSIIAILLIPLQTSMEEYLFRGYLMQGIAVLAKNRWVPLFLTSAIFGLMHIANPEVDELGNLILIHYIGTGFFLGIITLMDDGMELALGFHAGNNLVTSLLVTADWTVFRTHSIFKDVSEPSLGFEVLLPVFILYPIFLLILARKYKWANWRERLFGKVENTRTRDRLSEIGNP